MHGKSNGKTGCQRRKDPENILVRTNKAAGTETTLPQNIHTGGENDEHK